MTGGDFFVNGLPPGEFPVSIFNVPNGYTIRGSIVGTRLDLEEALSFAAEGKVKAIISEHSRSNPSTTFSSGSRLGRSTGELCSQSGRKRRRRHSRNPHETTPAGMTARIRGCWWTTCTNWKIVLRTTRLYFHKVSA